MTPTPSLSMLLFSPLTLFPWTTTPQALVVLSVIVITCLHRQSPHHNGAQLLESNTALLLDSFKRWGFSSFIVLIWSEEGHCSFRFIHRKHRHHEKSVAKLNLAGEIDEHWCMGTHCEDTFSPRVVVLYAFVMWFFKNVVHLEFHFTSLDLVMEVFSFGQKRDMGCFDLRGIQSDLGLGEKGCLVGAVLCFRHNRQVNLI